MRSKRKRSRVSNMRLEINCNTVITAKPVPAVTRNIFSIDILRLQQAVHQQESGLSSYPAGSQYPPLPLH